MRTPAVLRNLFLLLAVTSPALVLAQFQPPSDEELKMTADPKAPGAAAVFLNVEEVTNDPLHYRTFYARIKVLTEKGKELATVEVPYVNGSSKVTDIKARTIHADGTVIPLAGKPQDLLSFKTTDKTGEHTQINRMVFTLPSVEVGSILEYKYQTDYDENRFSSPYWQIQHPYPVRKAHYTFVPFKAFLPGIQNATSRYLVDEHDRKVNTLIWWPKLPEGVKIQSDASGHFNVDVADIPPSPDEEWMPPIQSILYKVLFYYKAASSAQDFWTTDAKLWSKDVDHFAEPSKALKAAVASLVAPTDSELDKAKKLYKAVQALDNTDYSRRKSEAELKQLKLKTAKHAEDTWTQKSGSSEDIALLYLAMLRAAGLNANALKVVSRNRAIFDVSFLSLSQLDDTLVALSIGGKEIMLDPGEKMAPFQTVNWRHSAAGGIRQMENGPAGCVSPSQAYPDNKTSRFGDVTLDGSGGLVGSFHFDMTGQEALYWRQQAIRNDLDEVKKQFDKSLERYIPEGVEAHIDSFTGLDDPDANLVAIIKAKGSYGSATSKRILLPAYFFETRGLQPFVAQEKRTQPVDMHYGTTVYEQVTFHLPAGYSVEGAPQDAKIPWPQHAVFSIKSAAKPGQITLARSLSSAFTFAKPDEYQELRGFYQKVAASDQQQIVLTRAPESKGN